MDRPNQQSDPAPDARTTPDPDAPTTHDAPPRLRSDSDAETALEETPWAPIDSNVVVSWLLRTREISPESVSEAREKHPDLSFLEALREAGIFSEEDLESVHDEFLLEMGLPKRMGSLEIVRELGRGGMAIVLEARGTPSGRGSASPTARMISGSTST